MGSQTATEKQKEHSMIPINSKSREIKDRVHDRVSRMAYGLFEQRGKEQGQDISDWHEAESRIKKPAADVRESSSWYVVNQPIGDFRPDEISIAVEPDGALIVAEQDDSKNGSTSLEALFLVVHWPAEVDPSSASAYVKDGTLTLTAKQTSMT